MRWGWFWFVIWVCTLVLWACDLSVTMRVPCEGWHFDQGRKCTATFVDGKLMGVSWRDR